MKILTWDSGYCWDDPNLRWGNPSYILEPGDPGYVPNPNAVQSTAKRKKAHMKKDDYISKQEDGFAAQLKTFATGIPGYATLLGVSAPEVTAQAADANYFNYVLACQKIMQAGAQQWTAWKNLVRGGGVPPPDGTPAEPVFPTTVTTVGLGVEVRFRALVKRIKVHPGYNEAIGEALGIEGAVQTGPDMATIQPLIRLSIEGGQVFVDWNWQGFASFLDSCELQVDRGQGFVLLAQDTTPGYTDTTPLPATPTKWIYRAIYRVGDDRVGQWSNPVTIMVG